MKYFSMLKALLLLTGLLVFSAISTSSLTKITTFLKRDIAKFQLVNILEVREGVRSALSCSKQCATHSSCGAVLYHQTTRSCTLGKGVGPGVTGSDSALRLLSVNSDGCPHKYGYTQLQISGLDYCLKMSTTRLNFAHSQAACKAHGGTLYHIDGNAAKMKAMKTFTKYFGPTDEYWIGIDDRETEGTYVWTYNGKKLNNTELRALDWEPGEPNDYQGREDCGQYLISVDAKLPLNDDHCFDLYFYLCEILL